MICINAEQLQDGLYNIKNGKIYKYKAKGGTVRTYELRNIVTCGECKWSKANGTYQWCGRLDSTARITADDFCSYGERREP